MTLRGITEHVQRFSCSSCCNLLTQFSKSKTTISFARTLFVRFRVYDYVIYVASIHKQNFARYNISNLSINIQQYKSCKDKENGYVTSHIIYVSVKVRTELK
jgi:hypothetical protein